MLNFERTRLRLSSLRLEILWSGVSARNCLPQGRAEMKRRMNFSFVSPALEGHQHILDTLIYGGLVFHF